jgi:hypothetical protein
VAGDTPTERSGPKGCQRPRSPGRPGGALPTSWLRGWPPAAGRRPRPRGPASRVAAGGPARAAERGDPTGGAVPAAYRHRQPAPGHRHPDHPRRPGRGRVGYAMRLSGRAAACACCCPAVSGGRSTGRRACEAALHAWRCRAPYTTTLRRLIGTSVVVGSARMSRRHEHASGMAVSRRSGTSRPPLGAARLQARVGAGSASPPPGRADSPGQRTVSCASLAWRAVCLLADAPMLPGWDGSGMGHWAQLWWDPRPLPQRAGEQPQAKAPGVSGGWCSLVRLATYRLGPLLHCAVRWQTHRTPRPRGRSLRLVA